MVEHVRSRRARSQAAHAREHSHTRHTHATWTRAGTARTCDRTSTAPARTSGTSASMPTCLRPTPRPPAGARGSGPVHTRLPVASRPTASPGARSSQCTLPGAAWTDAPLTCEALTEAQLASAEAEAKTKMKRRVEGDLPYLEVHLLPSQIRSPCMIFPFGITGAVVSFFCACRRQVCHCTSCSRQGAEQVMATPRRQSYGGYLLTQHRFRRYLRCCICSVTSAPTRCPRALAARAAR